VQSPETNIRQFDLRGPCAGDPAWNEGGTALLACGSILRPTDGTSCEATILPSMPVFWLDSEHIVRSNTGEILNRACQPVDAWPLRRTWQVGAVTASGDWVLLLRSRGEPQDLECEFSIARVVSRPPLRRRWGQKIPCGMNAIPDITLAEGADAVCSSLGGAVDKPHCWAIHTARKFVFRSAQGITSSKRAPPLQLELSLKNRSMSATRGRWRCCSGGYHSRARHLLLNDKRS